MLQNDKARAYRRRLDKVSQAAELLYNDAKRHPDKSGKKTPKQIATDREQILKAFLLAGGNASFAVELLELLYDRKTLRQNLSTQLTRIACITGIALS